MNKEKNWGAINGVICGTFVMASLFCSFFPALLGTAIIFLIFAIVAGFFAVISGI
jgi:hypothetical protein